MKKLIISSLIMVTFVLNFSISLVFAEPTQEDVEEVIADLDSLHTEEVTFKA